MNNTILNSTILNDKEPTLTSVEAEIKAHDEEVAIVKARREEERRLSEKKALLNELAQLRHQAKNKLKAVKAQKKALQASLRDLHEFSGDTNLDADDIRALIDSVRETLRGEQEEEQTVADCISLALQPILGREAIVMRRPAPFATGGIVNCGDGCGY